MWEYVLNIIFPIVAFIGSLITFILFLIKIINKEFIKDYEKFERDIYEFNNFKYNSVWLRFLKKWHSNILLEDIRCEFCGGEIDLSTMEFSFFFKYKLNLKSQNLKKFIFFQKIIKIRNFVMN